MEHELFIYGRGSMFVIASKAIWMIVELITAENTDNLGPVSKKILGVILDVTQC